MRWSFREEKGVFIPSEFEIKKYRWSDVDEAQLFAHRQFTLEDVRINETLDLTVFDVEKLGLQYGDRMADFIENRVTVFDGEQFVPAKQFKFRPDLLPSETAKPHDE